jgi:hypothetical protein
MIPFPGEPAPKPEAKPEPESPSTAITRTDDGFRMALEPHGFEAAKNVAAMVAKMGLCGVKSAEDAMSRIMTGRALGLPTMTSIRAIRMIKGNPSIEAKLKVALARRHPDCEYFRLVETTNERAKYVTKRRGNPEVPFTYTLAQAKQAGLLDRGDKEDMNNWNARPDYMLRARASSGLVDIEYPDATLGLPSTDEMYDAVPSYPGEMTGEVVEAPAAAAPPQAAPARDFAAEVEALKGTLPLAKTDAMLKEWRQQAARLSEAAGEPHRSELLTAYNEYKAKGAVGQ